MQLRIEAWLIAVSWFLTVLGAARGSEQLLSSPCRFVLASRARGLFDLVMFRRRKPRGDILRALLNFGKRRPAHLGFFAHNISATFSVDTI